MYFLFSLDLALLRYVSSKIDSFLNSFNGSHFESQNMIAYFMDLNSAHQSLYACDVRALATIVQFRRGRLLEI